MLPEELGAARVGVAAIFEVDRVRGFQEQIVVGLTGRKNAVCHPVGILEGVDSQLRSRMG